MTGILYQLTADDIPWALARIDLPERVDLLALNDSEIYDHACLLQREVRSLRAIVKAAIQQRYERDRELETTRRTISRLRSELRVIRQEEAA